MGTFLRNISFTRATRRHILQDDVLKNLCSDISTQFIRHFAFRRAGETRLYSERTVPSNLNHYIQNQLHTLSPYIKLIYILIMPSSGMLRLVAPVEIDVSQQLVYVANYC
jgi:hypothetical protein